MCLLQTTAGPVNAGYVPMSPRLSSPAHPSSAGGVPAGGRGRGEDRRNTGLIGQTVRIVQGPYKGTFHSNVSLFIIIAQTLRCCLRNHTRNFADLKDFLLLNSQQPWDQLQTSSVQ